MNNKVPQIAFLGVSERVGPSQGIGYALNWLNILNLRKEVFCSLFPMPLSSYYLVVAIYNLAKTPDLKIIGRSNKKDLFVSTLSVDIQSPNTVEVDVKKNAVVRQSVEVKSKQLKTYSDLENWTTMYAPIPNVVINEPCEIELFQSLENKEMCIGKIILLFANPGPLSDDRINAIKSSPQSCKTITAEFGCNHCPGLLKVYTGLEKSTNLDSKGYSWYQDIDDEHSCECGKLKFSTEYIKKGLHGLLGEEAVNFGKLSFGRLYEKAALERVIKEFRELINANPGESEVQQFMENNLIVFHAFSASRIIKQAPILSQYKTDFAIVSKTGTLYLVEIEKPGKRILKKNGGGTADFSHPFDQVNSWLHLVKDNRLACLEMMKVDKKEVTDIKGVVIIGTDSTNDLDALRRLKSVDYGETKFMTYDDLLGGLISLAASFKEI